MIGKAELQRLAGQWSLDLQVVQKDYVLGWLLAGIGRQPALQRTWVFKGGTCLRRCYYETYRFSEDLDFTVIDGGPTDPGELHEVFGEVAGWVMEQTGIRLDVPEGAFRTSRNLRGSPTVLGKVGFVGPNPLPTSIPKIRLDITADELVVHPPVRRSIVHPYSDRLPADGVLAYAIADLFAEKLRALGQRCRPRDLYDVVHLYRHPDLAGQRRAVVHALELKSGYAGIATPTLDSVRSQSNRQALELTWEQMLGHQLPRPTPPLDTFWDELDTVFGWLAGSQPRVLPHIVLAEDIDPDWSAPAAIASWRPGVPLEAVRYAGANRLKVDIDYRPEGRGRRTGPRRVEPYALRRTRDGHLLLMVVNDRGELRSYRVDRIAGIRPTAAPFTPSYRVEF